MASNLEGRQVKRAVNDVAGEQAAEKHEFGEQKYPHAEAAGLALLLHVFKLVRESWRVRLVDSHVSHGSPWYAHSRKPLRSLPEFPQNFQSEAGTAFAIPILWLPRGLDLPSDRSASTKSGR